MIYFFYGDNAERKTAASLRALKDLGFEDYSKLTDLDADLARLRGLAHGDSLFASREAAVLSNVLENEQAADYILKNLEALEKSDNLFILLERRPLKETLNRFKKHAARMEEFKAADIKKEKINPFILADALERRDKKSAWLLFQKVSGADAPPEALAGIIFWKVKTMILNGSSKWSPDELENFSSGIVRVYHDSHRGLGDLETGLEKLILETL